ncbi:MAG TPA: thiamine pyrophosphate-binding protein [Armatimonadota bacterium]|nr:thiamine pyrophosphate-binding protein [Armatimonadota bacterium]
MNGAELLVRELQARGIDCVFTLTGNGLAPLMAACGRLGMRVIDTRNEQAAAYQADGIGRMTRRLGVCAVSSGVAHVNALSGVANAWYDGSPMLLITGGSESDTRGKGHFQDMDTAGLAAPLCKYCTYVSRVDQLISHMDMAIEAATTGRPGPVHLTVPVDVLVSETTAQLSGKTTAAVVPGGPPDAAAVAEAAHVLASSARPFVVAGSGVFYADAASELASLARALGAPVVVPIWDRGAVEQPLPEFVGVLGAASGQARILPDADAVLLVGARVDYRVGYLEPFAVRPDAQVVRISADADELTQGVEPHVAVLGDPRRAMEGIRQRLAARGHVADGAWLAEARRRHREFLAGQPWRASLTAPSGMTTGPDIIEAIREVLTDQTYFLIDGGNIGQWVHMAMADRYPGRWMTCGRSAVIGWGIPTAAAVRAYDPEAPIVLLSGDGSATFTIAELECAARQQLPFVAVVADDSAWGIVLSGIRQAGGPSVGAELGPIDFVKVAEGLGCRGLRVDEPSGIADAIRRGLTETAVPTVIHVPMTTGGPADP